MLSKVSHGSIKVGDDQLHRSAQIKILGVTMDEQLNMSAHLTKVCRAAHYHLHNLRSIKKFLSNDACTTLVHALVFSQLDYCNALLYGLPAYQIEKLQKIQNAAARLLCNKSKFEHIRPTLKELHWLPVRYRILFKIAILTFKALVGQAPSYIRELIVQQETRYSLRSASTVTLVVPRTKQKTLGDRSFAVAAPTVWNDLPPDIRSTQTLSKFKSLVKTHYFKIAFHDLL